MTHTSGRTCGTSHGPRCAQPSYIVGLGASAGGLDALEQFFANVPTNTQMAFVVAQHLSPNFETVMDKLLARQTEMPVVMAEQDTTICAGHVYVLPPRKQMIVSENRLLVTDKDRNEDFFLPIDVLFRSLGQNARSRSIGVILSGAGGDGSRGIEHIHRAGGLVVSQSVESAEFDGMVRSAQATGLVDVVSSPEEMAAALETYAKDPTSWRSRHQQEALSESPTADISSIIELLRKNHDIDFSQYRTDMVQRRILRRVQLTESPDLREYTSLLENNAEELSLLHQDLLIGLTGFFRDTEAYERLAQTLIPDLVDKRSDEQELRIWVAATATGEEAYSIAMLVDEYCVSQGVRPRCRIFATDVNQASLDIASQGLYRDTALSNVSTSRLERYFRREPGGYRVSAEIRSLVVFAHHNVMTDAPFTKLDLISCRNFFIYLKPSVQHRILSLFHFSLRVSGGLWLGSSEVPTDMNDEFTVIDSQWKLYSKRRNIRLVQRPRFPPPRPLGQSKTPDRQVDEISASDDLISTYDQLLDAYMPPGILITESRRLIQTFGGGSRFLRLVEGIVTQDVADQLDPSLRVPLATAIRKAKRSKEVAEFGGIVYPTPAGARHMLLRVRPLEKSDESPPVYLVEFNLDETRYAAEPTQPMLDEQNDFNEQLDCLERELAYVRESLHSSIEELQISNEEMQSTNEELVASTEQLQSTNEELHSVNEELFTVNTEHQRKIAELTEVNDDLDNLLNSTDIDTVFLDRELRVRKFTSGVARKFNLLPQDVGRAFDSFTYQLDDLHLMDEIREVLRSEQPFEREVDDRDGNVYLMRILPYVSRGSVDGAVLTLVDITSLKQAQVQLDELSEIVQQSDDAIFRVDRNGLIRTWNDGAEKLYDCGNEVIGNRMACLLPDTLHDELDDIIGRLSTDAGVQNLPVHVTQLADHSKHVSMSISPVRNDRGLLVAGSVVARDVTAEVAAEEKFKESIERRDQFLAMLSHELRNPLGAIVNAARLIKAAQDDSSLREKATEIVNRQCAQMSRLMDDLLDVSRITLGKIELKREVFDLGKAIAESVLVISSSFEDSQLDFQLESYDKCLAVNGDPVRLQQVIVNLLRNAVKYTPPDGTIRLAVTRRDNMAEVRVSDSGIGIAPEMLDTVFDMFVQAPRSLERRQGGIGLGLTLVQAVTEMHGGTIQASSKGIGHGSEFLLRLPLTDEAPVPKRTVHVTNNIKTIVIVEDMDDARTMLCRLLELEGYQVHAAADGPAGLALIRQQLPDAALIDIGLPELSGYQVAKQLRAVPETEHLFLVALTGYGQENDRELVKNAGFDGHLVKPLNLDNFREMLGSR